MFHEWTTESKIKLYCHHWNSDKGDILSNLKEGECELWILYPAKLTLTCIQKSQNVSNKLVAIIPMSPINLRIFFTLECPEAPVWELVKMPRERTLDGDYRVDCLI